MAKTSSPPEAVSVSFVMPVDSYIKRIASDYFE